VHLSDAERARAEEVDRLVALGPESLPPLLGMLTDPSWVVRRAVVAGLAAMGDAAVRPLCELLATRRDNEARIAAAVDALSASTGRAEAVVEEVLARHPDPAVAADAAQVLGRRRREAAVPALVALMGHADDNVAVAAIEALGRVGGRAAVESLVAAVKSGNFFRTFPAIDVLGRSGDPRAVEPLALLLQQPSFALEAARALGRTGERGAVGPLARLLASPGDAVVRVAALALGELQERLRERAGADVPLEPLLRREAPAGAPRRLVQSLSGADTSEAVALCRVLGAVGTEESLPALFARLDAAPAVARAAADALKRLNRESEAPLLQALREGGSAQRKALLPVVGRTSAVYEVVRCLDDADPEVRALACDALARLGNTTVVERLFRLLEDPNPRVAQAASGAIQALGSTEARALALKAAASPRAPVRRAALRILAYFGHPDSLPAFLAALGDEDVRVREAAIQGLPYVEDKRALEALLEVARGPDAKARGAASRALGQCGTSDPRVQASLLKGLRDADAWVRYFACQSLGKLGFAPATGQLAALLSDEAGQVRVAAVEALSHLDTPQALAALRAAARAEEPDVQRAALIGLGISGHEEDAPLLLEALATPDTATRLVALSALAALRAPAVLPTLSQAAADADEQVSTAAVGFLSARPEQEATEVLVGLLSSPAARERALSALAVPATGRVSGLRAALEGASDELAPLLTSVLARLQRHDATAALLDALKAGTLAARKAAAGTLSAVGTPPAMAALREAAAGDPDPGVRQVCSLLLSQ
jgi:HEAT repeat protein